MAKAFAKVAISEESFRAADVILSRLELETRIVVLEKAVRAAASPVVRAARQNAPDSRRTGSRDLWSKKLKQARANTKQHKDTIGMSSVRNYRGGLIAVYVGPLYPAGNLINAIGHPHEQVLWGRRTGKTLPPTDYLERAGKSTTSEVQAAFIGSVQTQTEKILSRK